MNQSVSKAGFFPRLGAYLVDSVILGILILCLEIPVGFLELCFPDMFIFKNVLFHFNIFDILFYLLTVAYFVLATTLTGTTIGKRLFNLAVVDKEGNKLTFLNALYRETVGKYLSNVFYFGYIMIFIDKENRAFHDYLCDSSVIYTCTMRVVKKVQPAYTPQPQVAPVYAAQPQVAPTYAPQSGNLYIERTTPQSSAEAYRMQMAEKERMEECSDSSNT